MVLKNVESLNKKYLEVHKNKEELFWSTYMGTGSGGDNFERAEIAYKNFISDGDNLNRVETLLRENQPDVASPEIMALKGWQEFFKCHVIQNETARNIQEDLIRLEAALFKKRSTARFYYQNESGEKIEASTLVLSTNLVTHQNEAVRKSSHTAFLELEKWVLENGFLEIVEKRNKLAHELGYPDYFEYSVQKNERLSTEQLFTILDDFERRTEKNYQNSLEGLKVNQGEDSVLPHNFKSRTSGEVEKKLDPYMPFEKALRNWALSFSRMNIDHLGAELTLDLFDRKGKHENGFMHGPVPSFFDGDTWNAARINFTSNANPGQVGSGYTGLNTLFHEGGHAAHFANITMNAPCFSQESPPTSMAYAETQSMFCDSIIRDADWLKLYGRSPDGEVIPDEIIKEYITAKQPFFSFGERSLLVVPYFERALYQLDKSELTPEKVIQLARQTEKQILKLECSPRPILAIPHLLSDDSACTYHGYLLANMAVYQTRNHFIKKDGFLADNGNIGPSLARHYWNPGNSKTHSETLLSLTGEDFTAEYLADQCNKSPVEAWQTARSQIDSLEKGTFARNQSDKINLNAKINVVHGSEKISDNDVSYEHLLQDFENWVVKKYRNH